MSLAAAVNETSPEKSLYRDLFIFEEGKLTWRVSPCPAVKKGTIAGSIDKKGYMRVKVRGKWLMQHRVVWVMHYGAIDKGLQIDHINHNRTDNRLCNLRLVDGFGNGRNRTKNSNNKSGVTGVYFKKSSNKWVAAIRTNGKCKHLGYFSSIDDAIEARKTAEKMFNFHENHGADK